MCMCTHESFVITNQRTLAHLGCLQVALLNLHLIRIGGILRQRLFKEVFSSSGFILSTTTSNICLKLTQKALSYRPISRIILHNAFQSSVDSLCRLSDCHSTNIVSNNKTKLAQNSRQNYFNEESFSSSTETI